MATTAFEMKLQNIDVFASNLADVYRGLVRVGWSEESAREFVDGLNENRYEVIKLRKKVEVLQGLTKGNAPQVVANPQRATT